MSEKKEGGLGKRKKAEKELRSSEERFRVLFEYAPDGIYLMDLRGNFTDGNKAAEELVGYRRGELIGKNMAKVGLLPKSQIPKALANLTKNAMGRPTGPDYFTLIRKDGNRVEVEIRTYPVKIKDKTLVLGIARDITKRKKAGEILKESEEKYRILAETSSDGIFTTNKVGFLTYANPSLEKMFGIPSSQALGTHFSKYITKKSAIKALKLFSDLVKGKGIEVKHVEFEAVHKDKHTFPIEVSSSPMIKDGKFKGIECIVRDVTERKKADEEIRESEEKFRTIFESANDIIMYVDRFGKIIDINKKVEDILGYKREDVVGKNFAKIGVLTVKDLPRMVKLFVKSIGKGSVLGVGPTNIMELRLKHKNGKIIPLESSTQMVKRNGKVEGFLSILRDVTERKKADEELRKSKKGLEDKIYDLESFSKAGVGRELKMVELKDRIKELEKKLKKHGIEAGGGKR